MKIFRKATAPQKAGTRHVHTSTCMHLVQTIPWNRSMHYDGHVFTRFSHHEEFGLVDGLR